MNEIFPEPPARHRVLVVDDDELVVESLSILFQDRWEVSTALSASEARAVLAEEKVTAIVADDRMPGETGVELLAWAAGRHPGTVRILLTGYADASSVVRAVNEGRIWHYVRKPWDNHELINLIERGIEHRESQAALERSERLYRELFQNAHLGIVRLTSEGRIVEANRAFTESLGYANAEELVDVLIAELCAEPGCWEETMATLRDRRVVDNVELRLQRPNQSTVHLLVNASLRQSWGGEEVAELSTLDLTQQRRALSESAELREQVVKLQRHEALTTLSSGIAHDFSNQMTVILNTAGYATDLLPEGDDELASCMTDILDAARSAGDLSRQLLTFARGRGGERHPVDVNAVVSRVARLAARAAGARHQVERRLADDLPSISGNAGELLHCLLNLGLNAIEAMPRGGKITFETRLGPAGESGAPGAVVVSVRDEGEGMSEEVRSRIFEPFFTTKGGSASGGGTGLGLAMVKGIVEQHDGSIAVESVPGAGSVFVISLPALEEEAGEARASSPPAAPVEGLTVLIADDLPVLRKLVTKLLEGRGHAVVRADNGQEAVDLVASRPEISLAVLDVVMPVLDGEAAFEKIRSIRPDLPVIFTTGHITAEGLGAVLAQPRTTLLKKPFGPAEMIKTIETFVEG